MKKAKAIIVEQSDLKEECRDILIENLLAYDFNVSGVDIIDADVIIYKLPSGDKHIVKFKN